MPKDAAMFATCLPLCFQGNRATTLNSLDEKKKNAYIGTYLPQWEAASPPKEMCLPTTTEIIINIAGIQFGWSLNNQNLKFIYYNTYIILKVIYYNNSDSNLDAYYLLDSTVLWPPQVLNGEQMAIAEQFLVGAQDGDWQTMNGAPKHLPKIRKLIQGQVFLQLHGK